MQHREHTTHKEEGRKQHQSKRGGGGKVEWSPPPPPLAVVLLSGPPSFGWWCFLLLGLVRSLFWWGFLLLLWEVLFASTLLVEFMFCRATPWRGPPCQVFLGGDEAHAQWSRGSPKFRNMVDLYVS